MVRAERPLALVERRTRGTDVPHTGRIGRQEAFALTRRVAHAEGTALPTDCPTKSGVGKSGVLNGRLEDQRPATAAGASKRVAWRNWYSAESTVNGRRSVSYARGYVTSVAVSTTASRLTFSQVRSCTAPPAAVSAVPIANGSGNRFLTVRWPLGGSSADEHRVEAGLRQAMCGPTGVAIATRSTLPNPRDEPQQPDDRPRASGVKSGLWRWSTASPADRRRLPAACHQR